MSASLHFEREILRPKTLEPVHDFAVVNFRHGLTENLHEAGQRVGIAQEVGMTEYEHKDGMFDELVSLGSISV